jgi:hypothetical protein
LLPDWPAAPPCPALALPPAWLSPALLLVPLLDSPDCPPGLLLAVPPVLLVLLPLLPPCDGWEGNGDSRPPLDELVLVLLLVLPPWVCGKGEGCEGEDDPGDGIDGGCGIDGACVELSDAQPASTSALAIGATRPRM